QFPVYRRAQTRWRTLGGDLDHRTGRGAGFTYLGQIGFPHLSRRRIRTEEGVPVDLIPVPARTVDPMGSDLHQRTANGYRGTEHLPGDSARCDAHGGLTGRGAAASAIVPDAVFQIVGDIGVAGPELGRNRSVVAGTLVLVLDDQA